MPRDTVTVPREVLERAHGHLCKIAGTECWTHNNLDGWQATPGALREYAENAAKELDEALTSSDPEGGARGETWLSNRVFALTAALRLHDDYMSEQFSGPDSDALHPRAAANWRNIRDVLANATKSDGGVK